MIGFLFVLCLVILAKSLYTNEEARKCFYEVAVEKCSDSIQKCLKDDEDCKVELEKYQKCGFGEEAEADYIFNGYCFRIWSHQAFKTRPLLECLDRECNLLYNSVIGLPELHRCTEKALFENYQECKEECSKVLNQIQGKFPTTPLEELFQTTSDNQTANHILKVIRTQCIEKYKASTDGKVPEPKPMVEQQDL